MTVFHSAPRRAATPHAWRIPHCRAATLPSGSPRRRRRRISERYISTLMCVQVSLVPHKGVSYARSGCAKCVKDSCPSPCPAPFHAFEISSLMSARGAAPLDEAVRCAAQRALFTNRGRRRRRQAPDSAEAASVCSRFSRLVLFSGGLPKRDRHDGKKALSARWEHSEHSCVKSARLVFRASRLEGGQKAPL